MRQKMWKHLVTELRAWSPVHFVFDACVTGLITVVIGHVADMPWYLLALTILFTGGAVSSGMMLARGAIKRTTAISKNAPTVDRRKEAIRTALHNLKFYIEHHGENWKELQTNAHKTTEQLTAIFSDEPQIAKSFQEIYTYYDDARWASDRDTVQAKMISFLHGLEIKMTDP